MEIDPLEARPAGVPEAVLARIRAAVGPRGYTEDPAEIAPLCVSWRDNWRGWTPMVVRPASTAEVAEVVRICAESGVPMRDVPFSGEFGRNVAYYTGFVFEVVAPALGPASPIAGGGRYDGLLKAVGAGQDVPAVGGAIHTERLLAAVRGGRR